jgi:hypothetical protein
VLQTDDVEDNEVHEEKLQLMKDVEQHEYNV